MSAKSTITAQMKGRMKAVAFERFKDKTVMRDDKVEYFGSDGDIAVSYNSSRAAFNIDPEGDFVNIEGISDRLILEHQFGGKLVAINADIAAIFDQDFELLGTGAVSADMEEDATGGLLVGTHGGATDSAIIAPHLDTEQSPWTTFTWGTSKALRWDCLITTGAAITTETLWFGLKITNTPVVSTDDDSVWFRYTAATDTNWQALYSIATVDTAVDSGVAVTAATNYLFTIIISSTRVATMYINGVLVATTGVLTSTSLIPYAGVASVSVASVKSFTLRKMRMSKVAA